ncbi:MAG TPA: hypothetical protein PKU70_10425, partial [Vicinamibacteria bacterium]|nr:hypothetical protein [Vicinamibacteria bacterium]HRB13417.1 hypothetical protein [Vicinamibacteria bacterium]
MNRGVLKTMALAVVTLLPAAMVFPQGLADTAKKEQERRKKAAAAGTTKVYTQSDLPSSPSGAAPAEPDPKSDASKPGPTPSSGKGAVNPATSEEAKQREIADYRARAAQFQARIARSEAVVQQLGNHPTGGGKVCLLPEGVFRPGETAPEQVVCPYQMESRYEVAKRDLDKLKGEFAAFQDLARRRGIPL